MPRSAAQRPVFRRPAPQRIAHRSQSRPAPSAAAAPAVLGIPLRDLCELAIGLAWWAGVVWIVLAYFGAV